MKTEFEIEVDENEAYLLDRAEDELNDDESVHKITPDADLALKLTRAFNAFGFHKPDSLLSWHKRAAFCKALNILGIVFEIDYTAPISPRIFIKTANGQPIDIFKRQKAA